MAQLHLGVLKTISHDKVAEIKDAFSQLDAAGDGCVAASRVKAFLLLAAPSISEEEYAALCESSKIDGMESLTFSQFYAIVSKIMLSSSLSITPEQREKELPGLSDVFASYDPDRSGYISLNTFMKIMTEKGEPLSSEEAAEMCYRLEKMGFVKKKKVNYTAFVKSLTATDLEEAMHL